MYAIAFDIDNAAAEAALGPSWNNCYAKIGRVLASHGFSRQQGSVYFGDDDSSAVTCVAAVMELDRRYAWFTPIVRDLRMLRVDEDNDLLPLLSNQLRFDATGTG